MGGTQVGNVDVVAHAATVRGGEVVAIHRQLRRARVAAGQHSRGFAQHQRDQMGFRIVPLAQATGGIAAGGVEVA